jgi:hypothetical protein
MDIVKIVSQRGKFMEERFSSKSKIKSRRVPGYERGFWLLVVASTLMVAMMIAMESSRARPLSFGPGKQVEVERLPPDEARSLGISVRNLKKKI